jgi:DNA-binding MarR family transcriptional regulator
MPDPIDMKTSLLAAQCCLGFGVRKAARALGQHYDAGLAPAGLKGTQFSLLNAIHLVRGAGIQQLSEVLGMDRTTLTRNLNPLTKQGWVEVRPGIDRRERHVELTDAGRAKLSQALPLWHQAHARLEEGLGAERSRRLLEELDAVTDLAKEG